MTVIGASDVKRVTVLGAGTMGGGIAHVAAVSGHKVILFDINDDVTTATVSKIRANLDKGLERGKITREQHHGALNHILTTSNLEWAVAEADVVVEAVPEKLELKQGLFAEVATMAPEHTVLATNTSSLPIAAIAGATDCAERVVGMHFFNPVHIMKLIEVVRAVKTSDETVACATGLAEVWGKTPIVVKDSPGFASSRLGLVLGLEAIRMVESGVASANDIDTAMKFGYAHPMGPLELTDLVGLDVRLSIARYLATELGPHFEPPALLVKMVEEGKLGRKSGEGFYRWQDGKRV